MTRKIAIPILLALAGAPGCTATVGCPAAPYAPAAVELAALDPAAGTCPTLLALPTSLPDCWARTIDRTATCEIASALTCQSGGARPVGPDVEITPDAPLAWDGEAWTGEGTATATVGATGEACETRVRITVRG